jgi:hypothetical protein
MIWALIVSAVLGAVGAFLGATVRRRSQRPPEPPEQR